MRIIDFRDDRVDGVATPQERHQAGDKARAVVAGGAAETATTVAAPEETIAGTGTVVQYIHIFAFCLYQIH